MKRRVAIIGTGWVGAQGASEVLTPEISADERARLHHSADVLRQAGAAAGRRLT